tara:strand:- start:1250 stop:3370 length:2121 start_codon:yes stop_codon:yes gene_type:complete
MFIGAMRWIGVLSLFIFNYTFAKIDFKQDIEPLLQDYCIDCHGPKKQTSGFRLDRRAHMLKGGDTGLSALVPGDVENSYMIEVIKSDDPDISMPPKGGPLFEDEIEMLEQWIAEGAVWPGQMQERIEEKIDHWSFNSVEKQNVPNKNEHPIDAFLNLKLSEKNIDANEKANAVALVRRTYIVLTGIPPSIDRVNQFVKNYSINSKKAFDDLINELLKSPHFGERWAQHWLDVIRWAETNGSESNLYRELAWIYRDYVINSFNNDKPYNQFVREQIVGDELGVGEALGFLVSGPHVPPATIGKVPSAIRQARADRMDEIVQTVATSLMGVTMSCARCHNHKFDPISIQDYYSMTAVFNDIEFGSRVPNLSDDHPQKNKVSFVGKFIEKKPTYVFHRGSPENPRGLVKAAAPKILNGDLADSNESARARFAKWITEKTNPLTSRVIVNRIWQHIFGIGIVSTGGDFGKAGAKPSHPELLDYLASEFVDPSDANRVAWSIKDFIKFVVTTDAFQRSSLPNKESLKKDSDSRLLWRFPPRRVEAEVIRDGILSASGKLNRTIGGKSYRIHADKKTYAQWKVVNNYKENTWRRMIYQERMRRVDDQIFTAFDFPDCGQVRDKRPVSTTPLQALNLMNSNFVVDQSKHIAEKATNDIGNENTKQIVERCFELILTRKPSNSELNLATKIAEQQGLEIICRSLINSNEFAFLP